ncbi:alpha-glucosidase [Chlorogloeopsis fritschii PCC 6912]|uniref:Alpha-glucosidase n=1 Tax=Chlorogloeopsis fritschii PCC 6912 TaxID=211165 RepID=A0A3S0XMB9_CHLFR|nr:alpha-glucosidase [Chlorogloeopsis fritschii PCC 6912]
MLKSLFYLQYIPQAFLYSLKRDRYERYYLPKRGSESLVTPGKLLQIKPSERGFHIYFEQAELEIDFLTHDLVRLNWSPGLLPIPYAIATQDWDLVEVSLEEKEDCAIIKSDSLTIEVTVNGYVRFFNQAVEVLREELPPQWYGERLVHQAQLRSEEHIYGLGERASTLNLRAAKNPQQKPKTYQMWNYDPAGYGSGIDPMYICIPVYMGLHQAGSYLVFYENSFRAEFTFADVTTAAFAGGSLRYYMTIGEPADLIERYTQLTGRASLPPRWALGYHQSRWGYYTEAAIRQEVAAFQNNKLPLSAVHLDIDCQVAHRPFTIDPIRFPDLDGFIQELLQLGVHVIAINNPGVKFSRASNLFIEGQILNAFCKYPDGQLVIAPVWAGGKAFPDFTNPKVRLWWSRQYAYLLDIGVAGFWHDMNEPATFVSWGDRTLPQVAQHSMEGRGGNHREAHNLYGMLEAEAAYESLRQFRPEQRPFIVSRSGWAGLQRYAWTWTGDVASTWDALRQTISIIVGLGLSGIPYSGSDIGGFQGNPTAELYLRWFQMATFFTFYRTHCAISVVPRTPWTYGEPYLSILRRFLQLRDRLMPYFYTLAWETTQKGYPPVRPLFWSDWTDSQLWDVEDAFCLGDALLVCPIVQPGSDSRTIYLPKEHWYDFWNDTLIRGRQTIDLEAPLDCIPLLVKAGSILPMQDGEQLILHVYPPVSGNNEGCVYSDAGDGYGKFRLDKFYLNRSETGLEITWEQQGEFEFPYSSIQLQVHGISIQQAWIDEQEVLTPRQQIECRLFKQVRLQFN